VPQSWPFEQLYERYERGIAPSIVLPRQEHAAIPVLRGPIETTPRSQLAKDIWDLRRFTDAPNYSLQTLIVLNKLMYPETFDNDS